MELASKSDRFERLFESACKMAPELLLDRGEHLPLVLVGLDDKVVPVALGWSSEEEKQAAYAALTQQFGGRAEFYVFVTEAWRGPRARALDDLIGRPRPSEDPDRVEVLLVEGQASDGRHRLPAWQMRRDPKLRLIREGPEVDQGDTDSLMAGALLGAKPPGISYDGEGKARI